jgi:hypothetical protein
MAFGVTQEHWGKEKQLSDHLRQYYLVTFNTDASCYWIKNMINLPILSGKHYKLIIISTLNFLYENLNN